MSEYRKNTAADKQSAASRRNQGTPASNRSGAEHVHYLQEDSEGQRRFENARSGSYRAYTPADARRATANYTERTESKRKKKAGLLWRIVFWVALLVFVGSLGVLGYIGFGYYSQNKAYEEVAAASFVPPEDIEGTSLADLQVDWEALKAQNPETVAWVYIPGTTVNYPVVHTTNNDKYLTTDFFGKESYPSTGAIFLAAENAPDFSDTNSILYGHHMLDGSMFSVIDAFRESSDEFNAHRTIYVLTPQGNYRLTSFSVIVASGTERLAQPNFANEQELQTYIQDKLNRSEIVQDPELTGVLGMTKIFTLSTCSYVIDNGRAVLFAAVVESTVDGSGETQSGEPGMVDPEDAAAVEDAAEEM